VSGLLLQAFDRFAQAPGGVARLRELILSLAVRGKLVNRVANDESARVLLDRIATQRDRQPAKSLLRLAVLDPDAAPYELPSHWEWAQLGDLVENMGSGWSPACDDGERADPTRWAVLRTTAVQVMEFRAREHKAIPLKLQPRPEIEVQPGDILVTRAGPMNRVGVSCWVDQTPSRLMLSDKIVRFHPVTGELAPAFVVLALNAGWTREQLEAAKTGMAASQVNVSQADLKTLWVPVCSLDEQNRILARVDELMRLCDALEAKGRLEAEQHSRLLDSVLGTLTDSATPEELAANWQRVAEHFDLLLDRPEAVDALEQTILQLAVRGLLVPQDPSDEPASLLLRRLRAEKDRLVAEGKIKSDVQQAFLADDEAPFDIPVGWSWVRLGAIAGIERGGSPRPIEAFLTESPDGLNWIKIGDTEKGGKYITATKEKIRTEGLSKTRKVYPGDFLLTNSMSFGRPYITQIEGCIHDGWLRISPPSSLNKDYLYLFLSSSFMRLLFEAAAAGGVVQNLNADKVRSVPIPLPPIAEQAQIVARVTELRRLCADLRERLAASQATQSRLAASLVESVLA
jgi:type I restriction enzyme S subunit